MLNIRPEAAMAAHNFARPAHRDRRAADSRGRDGDASQALEGVGNVLQVRLGVALGEGPEERLAQVRRHKAVPRIVRPSTLERLDAVCLHKALVDLPRSRGANLKLCSDRLVGLFEEPPLVDDTRGDVRGQRHGAAGMRATSAAAAIVLRRGWWLSP